MPNFAFTTYNGFCPFCIVGDTRYYIQDEATLTGYKYQLMYTNNTSVEKFSFKSADDLLLWVKENKLSSIHIVGVRDIVYSDTNGYRYVQAKQDNDKIVVQKLHKRYYIGTEFDSYNECLAYAKAYLESRYNASLF